MILDHVKVLLVAHLEPLGHGRGLGPADGKFGHDTGPTADNKYRPIQPRTGGRPFLASELARRGRQ